MGQRDSRKTSTPMRETKGIHVNKLFQRIQKAIMSTSLFLSNAKNRIKVEIRNVKFN